MKKLLLSSVLFLAQQVFAQKFRNLALTPPMGWNSWNIFECDDITLRPQLLLSLVH